MKAYNKLDNLNDGDGGERRIEEAGLKGEGAVLLMRSRALLEMCILLSKEGDKLEKRMDEHESGRVVMGYDELDRWYGDVNDILNKMMAVRKQLRAFKDVYEELRGRVNKFYGREVMGEYKDMIDDSMLEEYGDDQNIKESPPKDCDDDDDDDDNGSIMGRGADWWKS